MSSTVVNGSQAHNDTMKSSTRDLTTKLLSVLVFYSPRGLVHLTALFLQWVLVSLATKLYTIMSPRDDLLVTAVTEAYI
jgi:hypothetical protein